jgi:carboxyl-terminal processing protease
MKNLSRLLFLLLLAILTITSCKKDDSGNNSNNTEITAVDNAIFDLMKEVYLWNDHLPASINPSSYATPNDCMDALRYSVYDRWSTVLTKSEFEQYFVAGQMIGHGFMLGLDANSKIRIAFVYRNTQAYNQGVRRGWIITKINGTQATAANAYNLLGPATAGRQNTITFIKNDGTTVDLTLTKSVIAITPVVHQQIIDTGDSRIGYFVFQDFIDTAKIELDEVFNNFISAGVNEVIVDMRYNGGGSVDVAEYLAGWLIGKTHGNQPFVNFRHNANLHNRDTTLNVPLNANGLSLNRVFFIGTRNTASASELVINGVKPYITSDIIAGDTTHGKPVGMYAYSFINYDYVVLPVAFKYTNANDEGDFYGGIPPTLQAADDLTRDFGDPQEESLKAILDYIHTGSMQLKSTRKDMEKIRIIGPDKGVRQYLKAY